MLVIFLVIALLVASLIMAGVINIDTLADSFDNIPVVTGSAEVLDIFKNAEFMEFYIAEKPSPPIVTYEDIQHKWKWTPTVYYTPATHVGQRKLFLAALQFLNNHAFEEDAPKVLLYAGSAPNNYAWLLSELFPEIKFVYCDPNEHLIYKGNETHFDNPDEIIHLVCSSGKSLQEFSGARTVRIYDLTTGNTVTDNKDSDNVRDISLSNESLLNNDPSLVWEAIAENRFTIIEDYFSERLCQAFTGDGTSSSSKRSAQHTRRVLFMSDIRTKIKPAKEDVLKRGKTYPSEIDVLINLTQQAIWVSLMKPYASCLKFRLPFSYENIDVNKLLARYPTIKSDIEASKALSIIERSLQDKTLHYFSGVVYLQAYPGPSSTESRLQFRGVPEIVAYDQSYEEKFYYYNKVNRLFVSHENSFAGCMDDYDYSNDCALESYIWEQYNKKRASLGMESIDICKYIHKLTELLGRKFINGFGNLWEDKMTEKQYRSLYKKYQDKFR